MFEGWAATHNVTVLRSLTLASVTMAGTSIASMTAVPTADAEAGVVSAAPTTVVAKVFVDASYEGDLLAAAGVPFAWGRESAGDYNESLGGRLFVPNKTGGHQFSVPIDYRWPNGTLLPMVYGGDPGTPGDADKKVQAYNFRVTLTNNASNLRPLPVPAAYDPAQWELLRRFVNATKPARLSDVMTVSPMPNSKTDINNNGAVSTDAIGLSWGWPTATPAQRAALYTAHTDYTLGFFHTLGYDPTMPPSLSAEMRSYGLTLDEFVATGGWSPQLYVREGRRMVGAYVFTQRDRQFDLNKTDSVGLFSYKCVQAAGRGGAGAVASARAPTPKRGPLPPSASPAAASTRTTRSASRRATSCGTRATSRCSATSGRGRCRTAC